MITFLKGSILRVRGGVSKGDYVNFWWVELPRINSSRDKGNNVATNSEGYATKIILLSGPLRIIFFKGINIISPGNSHFLKTSCLVGYWMNGQKRCSQTSVYNLLYAYSLSQATTYPKKPKDKFCFPGHITVVGDYSLVSDHSLWATAEFWHGVVIKWNCRKYS